MGPTRRRAIPAATRSRYVCLLSDAKSGPASRKPFDTRKHRQYRTVTMLSPLAGAASVALAGSEITLTVSFTSSAAAGARYPAVPTLLPAPQPPLAGVDETVP